MAKGTQKTVIVGGGNQKQHLTQRKTHPRPKRRALEKVAAAF
jgi:hypothetical protein